ncbi:MAG: OmpA family protein [Pseudomonadota bacterium]|nr:MAG: OmpA family protein [Pseudomonadota bacterium]
MKTSTIKNAVLATAIAAALAANGAAFASEVDEDMRTGGWIRRRSLDRRACRSGGHGPGRDNWHPDHAQQRQRRETDARRRGSVLQAEAELVESQSAVAKLKETLVATNDASKLFKGGLEPHHYSLEVLFRTASHGVEPQYEEKLDRLATLLGEHPALTIKLEGYADHRGDAAYNKGLSEQRIGSVKQALIDNGVDAARIQATAYGEAHSAGAENDVDGWALERRVSVSIDNPKASQGVAELKL